MRSQDKPMLDAALNIAKSEGSDITNVFRTALAEFVKSRGSFEGRIDEFLDDSALSDPIYRKVLTPAELKNWSVPSNLILFNSGLPILLAISTTLVMGRSPSLSSQQSPSQNFHLESILALLAPIGALGLFAYYQGDSGSIRARCLIASLMNVRITDFRNSD